MNNLKIVLFLCLFSNFLWAQCPIAFIEDRIACSNLQGEDASLFTCVGNGGTTSQNFKLSDLIGNELLDPTQAASTAQKLLISGSLTIDVDYTFAPNSTIIFDGATGNNNIILESSIDFSGTKIVSCNFFEGFKVNGVNLDLTLEDSYVKSLHEGIEINTGKNLSSLKIINTIMDDVEFIGSYSPSEIESFTLRDSEFTNRLESGLYFLANTTGFEFKDYDFVQVQNCTFNYFVYGLKFNNTNAYINNCTFNKNKYGICADADVNDAVLKVTNSTFDDNGYDQLYESLSVLCSNNNFTKTSGYRPLGLLTPTALDFDKGGSHSVQFKNNVVDFNTGGVTRGIIIRHNYGTSEISSNSFTGENLISISNNQSSTIVNRSNTFSLTGGTAYGIELVGARNVECYGNNINIGSGSGEGITLYNAVQNDIITNDISSTLLSNENIGFTVEFSQKNLMCNNDISNVGFGILLYGESQYSDFKSNDYENCFTGLAYSHPLLGFNDYPAYISNQIRHENKWVNSRSYDIARYTNNWRGKTIVKNNLGAFYPSVVNDPSLVEIEFGASNAGCNTTLPNTVLTSNNGMRLSTHDSLFVETYMDSIITSIFKCDNLFNILYMFKEFPNLLTNTTYAQFYADYANTDLDILVESKLLIDTIWDSYDQTFLNKVMVEYDKRTNNQENSFDFYLQKLNYYNGIFTQSALSRLQNQYTQLQSVSSIQDCHDGYLTYLLNYYEGVLNGTLDSIGSDPELISLSQECVLDKGASVVCARSLRNVRLDQAYGCQQQPVLRSGAVVNEGISVKPNPSHGVYKMEDLDVRLTYQYRIFNQLGSPISHGSMLNQNEAVIDLSSYPSGIYYLMLSTQEEGVQTIKLVKE